MEDSITKRLAITDLNFDKVQIGWLMKIFEGLLEKKIVSIKLYVSKKSQQFAVAEFENSEDSKKIYDLCDGIEIEDLKEIFNLSFIPENMVFENPIEEFYDSKKFRFSKLNQKSIKSANDIIDLSEEISTLKVEMSESENTPEVEVPNKLDDKNSIKVDQNQDQLNQNFESEDDSTEFKGFIYNPNDQRFKKLYEDDDFNIDASNYKFQKNPKLKEILKQKRRKYESDDSK